MQVTVAYHRGSGGKPAALAARIVSCRHFRLCLALTRQWLLLAVLQGGSPGSSIVSK